MSKSFYNSMGMPCEGFEDEAMTFSLLLNQVKIEMVQLVHLVLFLRQ